MIYKKDANFPYPLLTNTSNSYEGCSFELDINLKEDNFKYIINIDYSIESDFINKLIDENKARLVLIVQSKDNKFFNLKKNQQSVSISKTRISFTKRTRIQLLIQANEDINFEENYDLSPFYLNVKDQINVQKHSVLGFSNSVIFDGSISNPIDLFEKKIDPNLESEIEIELGNETIIIKYKSDKYQFIDSPSCAELNNIYVYMGLQRALYRFITNNGEDDEVDLLTIDIPSEGLDMKLYKLMDSKNIEYLDIYNIDEVICKITNDIIGKYTSAVRGLYTNGN